MWLEDSDLLDRNAIRAGWAEAMRKPARPAAPPRPRATPGRPAALAWLAGFRPRRLA